MKAFLFVTVLAVGTTAMADSCRWTGPNTRVCTKTTVVRRYPAPPPVSYWVEEDFDDVDDYDEVVTYARPRVYVPPPMPVYVPAPSISFSLPGVSFSFP